MNYFLGKISLELFLELFSYSGSRGEFLAENIKESFCPSQPAECSGTIRSKFESIDPLKLFGCSDTGGGRIIFHSSNIFNKLLFLHRLPSDHDGNMGFVEAFQRRGELK